MALSEQTRGLLLIGLAAGAAQVLAGVGMYLGGVYFAPWSMLVTALVLLASILFGMRWYRAHAPGGVTTYGQAWRAGVLIGVVTGVVYAVYNMVSIGFFYPDFLDQVVHVRIAALDARGLPHDSFEAMRAQASAGLIAIPNLVRLSLLGAVLSAGAAPFFRSKR